MNKFPTKGSSIIIKKALGVLLLASGFITLARPNFITNYFLWDVLLSVLLFISAFFLIIAGRQNK